jgi:hypothetical protein
VATERRTYHFRVDGETERLLSSLNKARNHVLGILEGLSEEQLRRPVLPSGWSCLGMVRHLALDDEHYWFRCIVAGEPLDFFGQQAEVDPGSWRLEPGESAEDIFSLYRDEIERSNAVIAASDLNAEPRQRDQWWGEWVVPDVRFIVLHVITETACHAGHLDAARELIDGRQWIVQ